MSDADANLSFGRRRITYRCRSRQPPDLDHYSIITSVIIYTTTLDDTTNTTTARLDLYEPNARTLSELHTIETADAALRPAKGAHRSRHEARSISIQCMDMVSKCECKRPSQGMGRERAKYLYLPTALSYRSSELSF